MIISSTNYFSIQGWMRTELNLSGNDLMVYAIIYMFSQSENHKFTGSRQYLADWCGCTKQGIDKNLKNLLDRGLIQKEEQYTNNVKFVSYWTTYFTGGSQQSCPNNKDNIKDNTIPKGIVGETPTIDTEDNSLSEYEQHMFTDDVKRRRRIIQQDAIIDDQPKKKRKTRWDQCADMIDEYTQDEELRAALFDYLLIRLQMKDRPMFPNQWKGMLNSLDRLKGNKVQIVRRSIERGWAGFFDQDNYYRGSKPDPSVFGEHKGMSSKKVSKEEREEILKNGEKF